MRIRFFVLSALAIAMALLAGSNTSSATSAVYSDPGVLGVSTGGNWADKLTFTDPNVTATFSVTNTSYKAVLSDATCMNTDTCLWWGTDDTTGDNCWDTYSYVDSDCDDETSLVNSVLALTPSSVSSAEGVTWTWRSTLCGNVSSVFPTPSNPYVDCPNVSTVTIQFSAPVSNAILHLNNIGGNGNYPTFRRNSLTTGFDMTLYSKWELTSGQSMVMLSGSETTNLMLDGNTIRNRFTPNGLGARVSNRECGYNEIACQYDNGTGSGSFLVLGTYSTLTFDIDLGWSLVNYGPNNPAGLGTMNSWITGNPNSFNIPEGVSAQISFYEEGPALPTTTTVAPTTVVPTTVAPTTPAPPAGAGNSETSTTVAPILPETGSDSTGWVTAAMVLLVGGTLLLRRRIS